MMAMNLKKEMWGLVETARLLKLKIVLDKMANKSCFVCEIEDEFG